MEKSFAKVDDEDTMGGKGEGISLGRVQETASAYFSIGDERDALSYQITKQKCQSKKEHKVFILAAGL